MPGQALSPLNLAPLSQAWRAAVCLGDVNRCIVPHRAPGASIQGSCSESSEVEPLGGLAADPVGHIWVLAVKLQEVNHTFQL